MKQRICRPCGSIMVRETTDDGIRYFCNQCNACTEFDMKEMEPYCPDCGEQITSCSSCCSLSFFCDKCGFMKSSKHLLWK